MSSHCQFSLIYHFFFPLLELVYLLVAGYLLKRGAFASLFPNSLACFLSPESAMELRTPTNASESIRIDLDSVTLSKNPLRTCYELPTNYLRLINRGICGQSFEHLKTLAPNSRLTLRLQEVTTDYNIQLRTSRNECVSSTNPEIYQCIHSWRFVGVRVGV